jgi:hypothetical protein
MTRRERKLQEGLNVNDLILQPRIIRVGRAPAYCGMSDRVFSAEIRPFLTEIPIGVQGKAFDRFELDRILDEYVARYGRAPIELQGHNQCKNEELPALEKLTGPGISIRPLTVKDFARAAARAKSKKPKNY